MSAEFTGSYSAVPPAAEYSVVGEEVGELPADGIGVWEIENDFEVQ